MEQNLQQKWEGKVSRRVSRATADQIWPLFTDFFNIHKYFHCLARSYGVHGTNGKPGCVRYCAGFSIPSRAAGSSTDDNPPSAAVSWSKERLVTVDHVQRCLIYEMVDSNIGLKSYVSTIKTISGDDNNHDGQTQSAGCVIEWSFAVDAVEGLVLADLLQKYDLGLQRMAKTMEDAIVQA